MRRRTPISMQQQPMLQLLRQQQQRMNMIVACCCDDVFVCETATSVNLRFSGMNAGICTPCQFQVDVLSSNVDGDYTVPRVNPIGSPAVFQDVATRANAAVIDIIFACSVFLENCFTDTVRINYALDCTDLNGAGMPRITGIDVFVNGDNVDFAGCVQIPAVIFAWFHYNVVTCGGTYYHGDIVPDGGPMGRDCAGGGCPGPYQALSAGGTVQGLL